jgi:hypothetical protein
MAQDKASATDHVEAGLSTEVVAPKHPCPVCSKATVDDATFQDTLDHKAIRICSEPACRARADWTSGTPVLLNN